MIEAAAQFGRGDGDLRPLNVAFAALAANDPASEPARRAVALVAENGGRTFKGIRRLGRYYARMSTQPADGQHAHHGKKSRHEDECGLVPLHLHYAPVAPFVSDTMFLLNLISDERAVRQYTRAQPDAHRAILALSRAVAAAGKRAREMNPKVNVIEQDARKFTAQEIWLVDLAIDVVAMFAGSGGLKAETAEMVRWRLRHLDEQVHGHHWQHEVRKAGGGPEEFRELRAHIPRHKPRG